MYAQIHNPTSTSASFSLSSWDGAAQSIPGTKPQKAWMMAYYTDIIWPDERRFLVSAALDHYKVVPPGTVQGDIKVVIEDGESKIEVSEEIWKVFREYKARGEEEEGERKV